MAATATSLKMSKQLKKRIGGLAKKTGQTPHAFMLRALEEKVTAQELRQRFYEEGAAALRATRARGYAYDLDSVEKHLLAKVAGKTAPAMKKVRWR